MFEPFDYPEFVEFPVFSGLIDAGLSTDFLISIMFIPDSMSVGDDGQYRDWADAAINHANQTTSVYRDLVRQGVIVETSFEVPCVTSLQ